MWERFIKVKVRGELAHTSNYLDRLRLASIDIHTVTCHDRSVTFYIKKQDIRKLKVIKRRGIKVYFLTRPSLEHIKNSLMLHKFTVILSLFSLSCYLYLTQILLFVRIDVVNPFDEVVMKETLETLGVSLFQPLDGLPETDSIRLALKEKFPSYQYFDISRKGGVMTIFGEAEAIEDVESTNQYAFHAPKKGLITSVIVYQGRKCVEVNQVVEKGDLLITGELNEKLNEEDQPDSAKESVRVPIRAEVMLNTWLKITGTYYMQSLYNTVNTKAGSYYQLRLNDWTLPLTFHRDSSEQQVITEKFYLPKLALRLEEVWPITPYKVDNKQNQTDLYQLAQKQLRQRILYEPHVQHIYDEKILHQSIENGKVNVTVFFSVLETYHIE
ncbi:MAG: sporulation protein YqfD [Bacillota bacterium]